MTTKKERALKKGPGAEKETAKRGRRKLTWGGQRLAKRLAKGVKAGKRGHVLGFGVGAARPEEKLARCRDRQKRSGQAKEVMFWGLGLTR